MAEKYSIQLLTQIKSSKWRQQTNLTWNGTSKTIVIYCIWWYNVRSIKMAMWENKRNYSKWKKTNTQFNYLRKSSSSSEVINLISLGMEPVRALLPNTFGCKMWEVSTWHCEKTTEIIVNRSRKIHNSITYTSTEFQVRSSVQSHLELNQ